MHGIFIFIIGLLLLTGCSSIEYQSDAIEKKTLPVIEESEKIAIQTNWKINTGRGVGDKDMKLSLGQTKNVLFIANSDGKVSAIDKKTGKIIWENKLKVPVSSGPSVAYGKVVVGTNDAEVIALNAEEGNVLWKVTSGSEVLSSPTLDKDVIYVHAMDGGLSALNAENGRQIWRFTSSASTLTLRRCATPAITDSHVIAGFSNGKLVAIRKIDGAVEWSQDVSQPRGRSELQRMIDISADPVVKGDVVYAASYQGNLVSLSNLNGQLIWDRDIASLSGFVLHNNIIYVSATNGDVWAVDAKNGETYWLQSALQGRRLSKPSVYGNYIVIGDDDGVLHWLENSNGKLVGRYPFDTKGIEATPVVIDRVLYVLGRGGLLTSLYLQPSTIG